MLCYRFAGYFCVINEHLIQPANIYAYVLHFLTAKTLYKLSAFLRSVGQ